VSNGSEPLILSVDTTSAYGSLALLRGCDAVEEFAMFSQEGHSQALFGEIHNLLARHDVAINNVDALASATGPGAFTGVRVGLAAVKGLAEGLDVPAYGVSNLMALAACGSAPLRAVVLDARRNDVFGAVYTADLAVSVPEAVLPFAQWQDSLPDSTGELICLDFGPFRERFTRNIPVREQRSLAAAIGRIAAARWMGGERFDAALLDANYVRRSDAELSWTE
jgi:tRNA threonylcarbamoyladenosine biosynthesis protein TsaB